MALSLRWSAAVALVALAMACGGEQKPLYTVAEAEGLLAQAALVREDLRVSLPETGRRTHLRQEVALASGLIGPQETLELLEKSAVLAGYSVDFESTPNATELAGGWVIGVHEALVLHNSDAAAALWLDYAFEQRDEMAELIATLMATSEDMANVGVENAPPPLAGDGAFSVRVAADLTRDARVIEVVQDLVFFRRGPVSVFLILYATRDRAPILETIVANADARVSLSLEQGPPLLE